MIKVVYIAGLAHSGTTLLTLILGQHPRFMGLGEVYGLLDGGIEAVRKRQEICSCGQKLDGCEFWREVVQRFDTNPGMDSKEQYQSIYQTVSDQFGADVLTVDSSKKIQALYALSSNPNIELKVIHIMKDVRTFTTSAVDVPKVRIAEGLPDDNSVSTVQRLKDGNAFVLFRRWYKRNKRLQEFLREKNIDSMQIGYDELILYPKEIVQKMCDFLDVAVEPTMLTLDGEVKSHVIHGNRIRHQPKRREVRYDNRWFKRREWILPALLMRNVMDFNTREVYKNTDAKRITKKPETNKIAINEN